MFDKGYDLTFTKEMITAIHQSVVSAHFIGISFKVSLVEPQLISAQNLVYLVNIFLRPFDCSITQRDLEFHQTMLIDDLIVFVKFPRVKISIDGRIQLLIGLVFELLEHSVDINISLELSSISLESFSIFDNFHFRLHLDTHRNVTV